MSKNMKSSIAFACVLQVFVIAVVSAQVTVHITPASEVKTGITVEITCTVTNLPQGTEMKWLKTQNTITTQIGQNDLIQDFPNSHRYSASSNIVEEGDSTFVLNIKDTQVEDSAVFACQVPVQEGEPQTVDQTLLVQVDVGEVLLQVERIVAEGEDYHPPHEFRNGDAADLDLNTTYRFTCLARGSNPSVPDKHISMTWEDSNGSTESSIADNTPSSSDPIWIGDIPGFQNVSYNTSLITQSAVPLDFSRHGMVVNCSAGLPNSKLLSAEVTIRLNSFPPGVKSCNPLDGFQINQRAAVYSCIIKANPAVAIESVSWNWEYFNGPEVTLYHGQSEADTEVTVTRGEVDDEMVANISFTRMASPWFHKTLILRASNEKGDLVHPVKFVMKYKDTSGALTQKRIYVAVPFCAAILAILIGKL